MIAPKGPGIRCASEYVRAAAALPACHPPGPRAATHDLLLSYGAAIGGGRAGIIETSFKEECERTCSASKTVLCGGLVELIRAGFETLVEAGYAP